MSSSDLPFQLPGLFRPPQPEPEVDHPTLSRRLHPSTARTRSTGACCRDPVIDTGAGRKIARQQTIAIANQLALVAAFKPEQIILCAVFGTQLQLRIVAVCAGGHVQLTGRSNDQIGKASWWARV